MRKFSGAGDDSHLSCSGVELTDVPSSVGDNLAVGADFTVGLLLPGGCGAWRAP